jgi:endogenous inhibitor of DNA gyrase (YacG/DUF329 family)
MIQRMPDANQRSFSCTICGRVVTYDGRTPATYPFCSQRCRMVDLGKWLNEQYTIERDVTADDLTDGEPPNPA